MRENVRATFVCTFCKFPKEDHTNLLQIYPQQDGVVLSLMLRRYAVCTNEDFDDEKWQQTLFRRSSVSKLSWERHFLVLDEETMSKGKDSLLVIFELYLTGIEI